MTVSSLVIPVPVGLPLEADVSIQAVSTTMNLEGIIFVRVLVSVAAETVSVSLVSSSRMVLAGIKSLEKVSVLIV